MSTSEITTVRITTDLRDQLWQLKQTPSETYEDVIRRLADKAEVALDDFDVEAPAS